MKRREVEAWYKQRMEIMKHESEVWSDKIETVKEDIENMENHPSGVKRKCAESDDEDNIH